MVGLPQIDKDSNNPNQIELTLSQCTDTEDASKNSGQANQNLNSLLLILSYHWADPRLSLNA